AGSLASQKHRLEKVAVLRDEIERLAAAEVAWYYALGELIPAQGGRDRRARLRPHGVDRGDRLPVAVLPMVDEHAATLLLQPLRCHEPGMLGLEPPRQQLREFVGLLERRTPGDRQEHVDPVGPARLHIRTQLE